MIARTAILLASLSLAACREKKLEVAAPPTPPARMNPAGLPVIDAAPVQTVPFELGYKVGYVRGKADAKPRAKEPPAADIEAIAKTEAGDEKERGEKWRSGFAAGYTDGFIEISKGLK